MKQFGLIGKNIAYSFSKNYFADKFKRENSLDTHYELFDLQEIKEVEKLFENPKLKGFNVTIPYKEKIIDYLDELSPEAKEIGAVNCVKIIGSKRIGFNTDAYGFKESIRPLLAKQHQKALIFGDGGAAKAIQFALKQLEIEFQVVSRRGDFQYTDLDQKTLQSHLILINTTPLGTYPNLEQKPEIPYEFIGPKHLVFDLIYNPEKTKFLKLAEKKGAQIKNGYEMLVLQAEKSWEIWTGSL